jgi:flagellar basal-body rod protein FlgB
MDINAIPLFSMLKSRLGYVNAREQLISQNVANADTSGYAPKDLKAFNIGQALAAPGAAAGMIKPAQTEPGHMSAPNVQSQIQWKIVDSPDSESTLSGNKVALEDEMAKMSQARMDYEAAVGFYQKAMGLLQMAARAPGK